MTTVGLLSTFLSTTAFVLLLMRLVPVIGRSDWRVFGRATESDLASLYIF
jgi:hypothetical protein